MVDDAGQEMRMDDPALLAELLEAEEDPEMKAYLQKQLKKTIKKEKVGKKKKIKKEKRDRVEIDHFPDEAFADGDDFGWQRKDAEKKMFVPSEGAKESIPETEEEKKLREAREAGEEIAPSDAPVGDADFGPTLPDTGIAPRPDTGAIPGGSKLKPVLDDEVVEQRLRQKALEKAIQERLDKRLMRQKRIEVRLAGWIGKKRALKESYYGTILFLLRLFVKGILSLFKAFLKGVPASLEPFDDSNKGLMGNSKEALPKCL